MKRLMAAAAAMAPALLLAACGGSRTHTSNTSARDSSTVSVRQVSGVGSVLVDPSGKALYTSDQEGGGKIVCMGGCTTFWKPLTIGTGKPTTPAGVGKLATLTRPDGPRQVTAGGKPLYTFIEDSPGKVTGNGFTDDFAGHHFTWHVVSSDATASGTATGSQGGSSAYP